MNLYLLRHADAQERPPRGRTGDRYRRLSEEGVAKAQRIGRAIRRLGLEFDRVLASPADRAWQTAEWVVAAQKPAPALQPCEGLMIGGSVDAVGRQILAFRPRAEEVLLVGHEPDLGRMMSLLLSGDHQVGVTFRKGGLAKLAVGKWTNGRCATLEWHLTPRQLRLIDGG